MQTAAKKKPKERDYRFGEKVTQLRISRGLTQEFIAAKMKISDGAVSKWETGESKPRPARAAELAKLLGVDVDQLLDDDAMTPDEAEKMKEDQREAIFRKVRKLASKTFGNNPPLEILDRYSREKDVLRHSDRIIFFDIFGEVRRVAKEKRMHFHAPEPESLIAWLLGASDLNPLDAHYRCPKCKKTEMHPEVRSGYDLPEKFCECGTRMIQDGHSIPFEITGFIGTHSAGAYKCDIDIPFMDEAEDIILRYGEQFFDMEVTRHRQKETIVMDLVTDEPFIDPETGKKVTVLSYPTSFLMFTPKKKFTVRKPEKISGPMDVDHWGIKPGQPSIVLWPGLYEPQFPLLPEDNFYGTPDELTRPEVMERAFQDYLEWLPVMEELRGKMIPPDYRQYLDGMNFSRFIDLIACTHCMYAGEGPVELAEKLGVQDPLELPYTPTDVYRMVLRCAPHPEKLPGLVRNLTLNVCSAEYYNGNIKKWDRALFRELNLPEWFEEYTQNIYHMLARSVLTLEGIRMLEGARRKIRDQK